ncbi:alpha/beta hydrolase [Thermoactinospora rubra]|uniref:alpha/beta hydrolase n=1 Tax=Thermoactinospora rubra TaxID=1088767 RepID=UPI000A0FF0FE|nr:alpha/beta hydrolase [Thermoactinospora rubra]
MLGAVGGAPGTAGARSFPRSALAWGPCEDRPSGGAAPAVEVECAELRVPLDHREPTGQQITLALNRIKGTVSRDHNHLGTLLVNPGGPGASGRRLAPYVAAMLPPGLARRYDIVGFDPRGVGGSEPSLSCVDPEVYYKPPRPDQVPRSAEDEDVLLGRAKEYATSCGNRWAWFLPYLTTENAARDMDVIRQALGEEKISYLGYSYGTYLGAVYATLFPDRVKRLALDSAIDPSGVWYEDNLAQNRSFERRHRAFLAWTARHDEVYKLGGSLRQTSFAWSSMRSRLRERPAGGVVGPSELDDLFTMAGYTDTVWPQLAAAWSAYVLRGDVEELVAAYRLRAHNDKEDENGYAVYLGVECRDAAWPRDWTRWRADMTRLHREAPFLTWPNAWYNAPCAFWPVPGGTPVDVRGSEKLPPVLILQARDDAATPYRGGMAMARRFPTAGVVTDGGGNHGVSLAGNECVDRHLVAYLTDGTRPRRASCRALPEPRPIQQMAAGGRTRHERLTEILRVRG